MTLRIITSAMLAIVGLLVPTIAPGQTCQPVTSVECAEYAGKLAAGACIKPGTVFVLKDKWEVAGRTKISGQKKVQFFYVVDGKNVRTKYDAIFVSIDRVGLQDAHTDVKLTQNKAFKFRSKEEKDKYSRAFKPGGQPTQSMRQWSYLPDIGSVFRQKEADVISKFDIPQAIGDVKHAPHARLYRYASGNISCIPFGAGLNSDINLVLGKVIDSSGKPAQTIFFQVSIE